MLLVAYPVYNHGGHFGTAEPEVKLGISPAKTPRPQRSENSNKQFFQDNLSSLRNLACFAPWRESSLLIASFMSNSKCLHLRGTTLAAACSLQRRYFAAEGVDFSRRTSPILMVSPSRSKYSNRGIVYFRLELIRSRNEPAVISPLSERNLLRTALI